MAQLKRGNTAHTRIKRGQPTEVTQAPKRIKINNDNDNDNDNSDSKHDSKNE